MEAKKRGGRPPKPAAEKLDQFSIRLPPKLKLGLELLARAQGRSLSQAIEWALQVGLNNYRASPQKTVAEILDEIWDLPTDEHRHLAIWHIAPTLLPFEIRAACELISNSREGKQVAQELPATRAPKQDRSGHDWRWIARKQKRDIVYDFAHRHFKQITATAANLTSAGKSLSNVSLVDLVGLQRVNDADDFGLMQANSEFLNGDLTEDKVPARVKELSLDYMWGLAPRGKKQR